jgi:hypothetical protein
LPFPSSRRLTPHGPAQGQPRWHPSWQDLATRRMERSLYVGKRIPICLKARDEKIKWED